MCDSSLSPRVLRAEGHLGPVAGGATRYLDRGSTMDHKDKAADADPAQARRTSLLNSEGS